MAWNQTGNLRGPKGDPGQQGPPGTTTWDGITDKPDLSAKADLVGGVVPVEQLPAAALESAVTSVNGQTGTVNVTADSLGAAYSSHTHTMSQVTDLPPLETPTREAYDRANKLAMRDSQGRLLSQNYASAAAVLAMEQELPHTLASLWAARQVANDAMKGKADGTSDYNKTGDTVARRWTDGTLQVADPTGATHAATKSYVDGRTPKYYGSLRWGNQSWYNPPANVFHRLSAGSGAKLVVHKNVGGVASISGDYARLYIPVAGMWLLSATQTWGGVTESRGMGLTTSQTAGDSGVMLWTDDKTFAHVTVTRLTYIDAGTYLYPWTWNGTNTGMSWSDRGYISEYSAALVQPM